LNGFFGLIDTDFLPYQNPGSEVRNGTVGTQPAPLEREGRELICAAQRTPVAIHEQIANLMATQWERGSEWAISHSRAFRDEIRPRVHEEIAACQDEKICLLWVGAGMWHDTDFYTAFEREFGGVFVWSMYLAFGPDGYIRYGLDDPPVPSHRGPSA
jgi:benzoyl-CoA reductase subunit B